MLRPIRVSASVRDTCDLAGFSRLHLLGVTVLLAAPAAGIAALRGFDGLYGQDAYAYFDYATTSVRDSILHGRPHQGANIDDGVAAMRGMVAIAHSAARGELEVYDGPDEPLVADVLTRLQDHPAKRIDELLPWNWKRANLQQASA